MTRHYSQTKLHYTGTKQPQPSATYQHKSPLVDETRLQPYKPLPDLVEAVNLALLLERPLLLRGEPGCGKTRLAEMVAFELGLPYFAWHIQSRTIAQDGLYRYDAVRRLHDVQMAAKELTSMSKRDPNKPADPTDVTEYIDYGPLGQAFLFDPQQPQQRPVVLIDEIDKADLDFPNDLLLALDENRFTVTESGQEITAKSTPIIFITSNDEKELPDAFLRRCLFFYIEFPTDEPAQFDYFQEIVRLHHPPKDDHEITLLTEAVNRFLRLRKRMGKDKGDSGKKASTSELLDWYMALLHDEQALERLANDPLPHAEALLKTRLDFLRYRQKDEG